VGAAGRITPVFLSVRYRVSAHSRCGVSSSHDLEVDIRAVVIHHSFTPDMDALGPAGGAMPTQASCVPVPCFGLVGARAHVKWRWDTAERLLSLCAGEDHSTIWDSWVAPPGAVPFSGA
jgi:hypothetical protein